MEPASTIARATLLLVAALASGCSSATAPAPDDRPAETSGDGSAASPALADPYARAVERSEAGDEDGALAALADALAESLVTAEACQRALLEPAFERSGLRDAPAFRDLWANAAVAARVSRLTLAREDEPGEWVEVDGRLVDAAGDPVPRGVVRVFATDAEGRYHPSIEGERVPRLFATLVADDGGRFGFRTVRPGPYPGTRNARHVHVSARAGDLRLAVPGYAVLDDDPLLAEPQNAEQRGEAVRIRMRVVDGVARGTLELPLR